MDISKASILCGRWVAKLVARLLATKYKMGHISKGVANKHTLASNNILHVLAGSYVGEFLFDERYVIYTVYMPFDDTGSQVAAYFLAI